MNIRILETEDLFHLHRVEVVNNTKSKIITLITCDETGAHRLMVCGSFVKKMPFKDAPQQVQHNFSSKYTTGRKS